MTTRGHHLEQESYWQRVGRRFEENDFGRYGLCVIIALFVVAALAPFLANSHALIRVADGHLSFPIFASLDPIEWRFLIYVPLAVVLYEFRKWILRLPRLDLGSLTLLAILTGMLVTVMPTEFSITGLHLSNSPDGSPVLCFFTLDVSPVLWIMILFGMLLFAVSRAAAKFLRWPEPNLTYIPLLVLFVEIALAFWHPSNDPSNDRDFVGFRIMPPIPWSPIESSPDQFAPPSWRHLCGTDITGRDIAARMLHGTRTSLSIGFVAQTISVLVGVTVGGLAGYFRGWLDIAVCRFLEVLDCFPPLLLILVVIGLTDSANNMFVIMAVIGLTSWTGLARLVRGEFLRLVGQPFPQAAKALGAGNARIIIRHLLPNALGPILVSATFGVASAILIESSLSFLGFGMQAPTPSWGDILNDARYYIDFAWWLAFFPAIAILVTIMSYNFVGEALRDAVDPRLKLK